ncbi:MAG TPA: hypothetical protein VMH04_15215 [Candidatus Solibacter sp.]|nr:hypothetical protein [Candidatus Solibacter sp.]
MKRIGILMLLLFTLLVPVTWPQAQSPPSPPQTDDPAKPQPLNLSPYTGGADYRFLRLWQYQYQYVEQPSTVLVQSAPGQTSLIANPEHNLNQHTVALDFGQLFLKSQDLSKAIQAALLSNKEERKNIQMIHADLCGKKGLLACVADSGGSWKRLLSGIKASGSAAEHVRVVQQILLPSGYGFAGAVDFDPSRAFVTGSDWKNATELLGKMTDAEAATALGDLLKPGSDLEKECKSRDAVRCAKALSSSKRKTPLALLPTFQYKRQTPYDFLKYSGILVPSSAESGLNTWSFTVDLRRLIAAPAEQLDAVAAANAIVKKSRELEKSVAPSKKICGLLGKEEKEKEKEKETAKETATATYIIVSDNVKKESCQAAAKTLQAARYALGCASARAIELGLAADVDAEPSDSIIPNDNSCKW